MKTLGDLLRQHLPILAIVISVINLQAGHYLVAGIFAVAGFSWFGVEIVLSYLEYRRKRLKDEPHLPCERPGGLY